MNTDTVKESSEERSAQDQVQSQSQGATNLEKLQIDNSRSQAGRGEQNQVFLSINWCLRNNK